MEKGHCAVNVPADIDVGYVIPEGGWGQIKPGVEPTEDTFVTIVTVNPIPPSERVQVGYGVGPGNSLSFLFAYVAPPTLSQPVYGMKTQYEFRAYKATE